MTEYKIPAHVAAEMEFASRRIAEEESQERRCMGESSPVERLQRDTQEIIAALHGGQYISTARIESALSVADVSMALPEYLRRTLHMVEPYIRREDAMRAVREAANDPHCTPGTLKMCEAYIAAAENRGADMQDARTMLSLLRQKICTFSNVPLESSPSSGQPLHENPSSMRTDTPQRIGSSPEMNMEGEHWYERLNVKAFLEGLCVRAEELITQAEHGDYQTDELSHIFHMRAMLYAGYEKLNDKLRPVDPEFLRNNAIQKLNEAIHGLSSRPISDKHVEEIIVCIEKAESCGAKMGDVKCELDALRLLLETGRM